MNSTFKFNTQKNNQYKIEIVDFVISVNKITCIGEILHYAHDMKSILVKSIGKAKGNGFNCSEAFMSMLDSIPEVITYYEKTHATDNFGEESFESNTNANEYFGSE